MNNKNISGRRVLLSLDADGLKHFWEKKIQKETVAHECEDARRNKSALSKLREEWRQKLECRLNMLQSLHEDQKRQLYATPTESLQPKANTAA